MSYELTYPTKNISSVETPDVTSEDYSEILRQYALSYRVIDHYLQVGEMDNVQGWIFHISVIRSQFVRVLHLLIPQLVAHQIPFKIAKDRDTAKSILDGNFGLLLLGKAICIYPVNTEQCIPLTKILLLLTQTFRGPVIPTDAYLGGAVYTRFGAHNPLLLADATGKVHKYIYDSTQNLVIDNCTIPFTMPSGIEWPFDQHVRPALSLNDKIIKGKYKILSTLKSDAKGNVYRAIYLRRPFHIKACVIKQGRLNMWSDDYSRDITERLRWQNDVYLKWKDKIRIPEVIDIFDENGDTYLVMNFIKGLSLHIYIQSKNQKCATWVEIPNKIQKSLISLILKIIDILKSIHDKGFVHRDITPANFLIDRDNNVFVIDNELSYSLQDKSPDPPFEFGTYGFMSPQQVVLEKPSFADDIYGLGATILTATIGIPPITFSNFDNNALSEDLYFFLGDKDIASIVARCLHPDPIHRPSLAEIESAMIEYRYRLEQHQISPRNAIREDDTEKIKQIIESAITGLVSPPTLIKENLWYSRGQVHENIPDSQRIEFRKSGTIIEGISGVMYLLARATLAGYNTAPCIKAYKKGWEYLKEKYLINIPRSTPSFYSGTAGIALAISKGIDAGLLENSDANKLFIQNCIQVENNGFDLANGIVGQGLTLLQCTHHVEPTFFQTKMLTYLDILSKSQNKKGYWITIEGNNFKKSPAFSLSHGNTGAIYFLLQHFALFNDRASQEMLLSSTQLLSGQAKILRSFVKKEGFRKVIGNYEIRNGVSGVLLCLMRSYELFKNRQHKESAEELLYAFTPYLIHENFSSDDGLAEVGELYIEAYRIFRNEEWLHRASWIAQCFIHTASVSSQQVHYWLSNNSPHSTAGLLVGNSGIIHFLIRHVSKGEIGYRLLT